MFALQPRRVLIDGHFETGKSVLVRNGLIEGVVATRGCPIEAQAVVLDGDLIPGFIDLQVNGGGGVLLNDHPTVDGIATIAREHRAFGTTGFLPTIISDDLTVVARAIAAVDAAIGAGVPGVLGIHIEGPFLNVAKKGIHDASKFRVLDEAAINLLSSLKRGRTLVTLAPERAPPGAIRELVSRGLIVAGGHSAATYEEVTAALADGLVGFTHLFNAMSPLGSREPGMVGAALDSRSAWCGIIVDGHHVHPATLRVALKSIGAERLMLVTDAMPTVGSAEKSFMLRGRRIIAEDGRCVAEDGTLAGSDLDMGLAVRNAMRLMRVEIETAVAMATTVPAAALGLAHLIGAIESGRRADLVLLDSDAMVAKVWSAGSIMA